ncbi:hypothetical protein [Leisingera sp. McT4-56]|uniref:hypothetical protein n=1 Tax=Leisingera sp. McT4-56 TaxID=2881255 RepID=UPI001CF8B60B|nr:hypothetical protein [Leisingera sp. McT4-56]MCB4456606.1 hypothetical protein [Leisingera sp. McT4-56]
MSVKQLAGFAAVCGLVFLGVDYEQQARRAGLGFAELGVSGYAATINDRYLGFKAERREAELEQDRRRRWQLGGKPYLPEAPAGMERFSLPDRPGMFTAEMAKPEDGADPLAELDQALDSARQQNWANDQHPYSWGYSKDGEVVVVSVRLRGKLNPNTLQGMVASSMSSMTLPEDPYAVIGGVAFGSDGGFRKDGRKLRDFKGIVGLGERATIQVWADASDQTIRRVLSAIDYDGLNSLLLQPVPTVGNDVTVPFAAELGLAEAITRLRDEMRRIESRAAQLKMEDIDPGKLVAGALTGTVGHMDVTGGGVPNVAATLETVFRERLTQLMAEAGAAKGGAAFQQAEQDLADEGADGEDPARGGLGKLAGLTSTLLGVFKGGNSQAAGPAPAPQDTGTTSQVTVSKGLAGDSSQASGCIRRGTTLTCD